MNARNAHPLGAPGFRLVHWLGAGGTASIYAAMDLSKGQPAAVKIFHLHRAEGVARLEQQLRANARLAHPNIVSVGEIGRTADGRLFHSMPLLLGFEQARHDLSGKPRRIAALLRELLDALGHAHQGDAVHGGIKPSNVLFDNQGHAQLADFGIARCMTEAGLPHSDAAAYLSPEQAHGDSPEPRSDLYAVGLLAYQLLTGTLPAVANAGRSVPRLPPRAGAWQAWIDRALADSPDRRFQTASEMADALGMVVVHTGSGRPARITTRKRVPRWTWLAAAVAIAIVALAGWSMRGPQSDRVSQTVGAPTMAAAADPGLPTAAATAPTAALPAVADSASLLTQRVQGLVAKADALRAQDHLFSPAFHNAASHYLAALAFDPGNRAASAGIDAMLDTLRKRLDKTWNDAQNSAAAIAMLQHGDALSRHAGKSARRKWRRFHDQLAQRVGHAVVQAAHAHDLRKIAALESLATALPAKFPDGFDLAIAKQAARTPTAGALLRDPRGPPLVYVPATGGVPAFAFAKFDVTRADYAVFARATHRSAAKCRAAHNPLSWLRHLSWQAPGFAQAGDHPVVCVSWNDAVAYAAWLSKTTGEPYRLPDSREWLEAARDKPDGTPCQLGDVDDASRPSTFDDDRWSCNDGAAQTAPVGRYAASAVGAYDLYGNVSEWLAGGSRPGAHQFRGLSWRAGSHETPLGSPGTANSDIGYTSVGFRVMRVIDTAHDAPPSVSAH